MTSAQKCLSRCTECVPQCNFWGLWVCVCACSVFSLSLYLWKNLSQPAETWHPEDFVACCCNFFSLRTVSYYGIRAGPPLRSPGRQNTLLDTVSERPAEPRTLLRGPLSSLKIGPPLKPLMGPPFKLSPLILSRSKRTRRLGKEKIFLDVAVVVVFLFLIAHLYSFFFTCDILGKLYFSPENARASRNFNWETLYLSISRKIEFYYKERV